MVKLICRANENPEIERTREDVRWTKVIQSFTVGKEYEVTSADGLFMIVNDDGNTETYTIEPDDEGLSYKDWFDLVDEESDVNA